MNIEAFLRLAEFRTHAVVANSTPLLEKCAALCNDLAYDEARALIFQAPNWERGWDAQLAFGIVHHREHRYEEARRHYEQAVILAPSAAVQATIVANIGTTWFEQNVLQRATAEYNRSLALVDDDAFALLGMLAIACRRRDEAEVDAAFRTLMTKRPRWKSDPIIQHDLKVDSSYRFLRQQRPDVTSADVEGEPATTDKIR
jgi:tetratricopeptide (TPR) repeat protein